MDIQWFPGHMAKARREVAEKLKVVDTVIELLDARIPDASRNPILRDIIQGKPTVVVLAKADLADETVTERYKRARERTGQIEVVAADCLHGPGISQVVRAARRLGEARLNRLAAKGIRRKAVRAMVLGIPNVGKSSLINRLAGRAAAKTGDRPGVTRQQQWVKVGNEFELLDTPGVLWPKFDDRGVALRLAWTGAIKSTLLDQTELAVELLRFLREQYPEELTRRYDLTERPLPDVEELLERVAIRSGMLREGGRPDADKAALHVLQDLRSGLLGRISLETPEDWTRGGWDGGAG